MARGLPPAKREVIEALCDEIEALARELADLQARGEVRVTIYGIIHGFIYGYIFFENCVLQDNYLV